MGLSWALMHMSGARLRIGKRVRAPEILDGRVKTLHPRLHAALLARRDDPEHMATLESEGIEPIDLVCVNLYPFERTVARQGVPRRRRSRTSTSAGRR